MFNRERKDVRNEPAKEPPLLFRSSERADNVYDVVILFFWKAFSIFFKNPMFSFFKGYPLSSVLSVSSSLSVFDGGGRVSLLFWDLAEKGWLWRNSNSSLELSKERSLMAPTGYWTLCSCIFSCGPLSKAPLSDPGTYRMTFPAGSVFYSFCYFILLMNEKGFLVGAYSSVLVPLTLRLFSLYNELNEFPISDPYIFVGFSGFWTVGADIWIMDEWCLGTSNMEFESYFENRLLPKESCDCNSMRLFLISGSPSYLLSLSFLRWIFRTSFLLAVIKFILVSLHTKYKN